jgi:hypothetical protein
MRRSVYGESMRRAVSWCPVFEPSSTTQQAAFLVEGFDRYEELYSPSKFSWPQLGATSPAGTKRRKSVVRFNVNQGERVANNGLGCDKASS